MASSSAPMRTEPTGWYTVLWVRRTSSAISSSVCASSPGASSRPAHSAIAGWETISRASRMPATATAMSWPSGSVK